MFTKLMLTMALLTVLSYTKIVWSAIDMYTVYNEDGDMQSITVLRSSSNVYDTGSFNTVILNNQRR